jgi:hypothetical protein
MRYLPVIFLMLTSVMRAGARLEGADAELKANKPLTQ